MRANARGLPELVERSSSGLGVRIGYDVPVDEAGLVRPEEPPAGMSVTPDWRRMRPDRIPKELGGDGRHPLFALDTDDLLGPLLRFRPDPSNPVGHGFIEPARPMSAEEYQEAIHATAALWSRVT